MVKDYNGNEMELMNEMGNGFREISNDPSLSRIEQYILRLLELLERNLNSNINKSAEMSEISAISKIIKTEIRKNKNKNSGMTGKDFLRTPYRVGE